MLTTANAVTAALPVSRGTTGIYAAGTWGGGTLTITYSPTSGGTFVALGSGVSLAADGTREFNFMPGFIKATLTGSTGASLTFEYGKADNFPDTNGI